MSRAIVGLSGGGGGQSDPVWGHSGSRHWMIHSEGSVASTERPGVWAPGGRGRGEGARGRGSPGTGGARDVTLILGAGQGRPDTDPSHSTKEGD